jgi:hypothetical protein
VGTLGIDIDEVYKLSVASIFSIMNRTMALLESKEKLRISFNPVL